MDNNQNQESLDSVEVIVRPTLIIGLDLSFSSTGITISVLDSETLIAKILYVFRILFDDQSSKSGKLYNPHKLRGVNNVIYRMPTNILPQDLIIDADNVNNVEQIESTLKAMICSKKICTQIAGILNHWKPQSVFVGIENYIMPSFAGKNQLKHVSGLITLQGFVRKFLIEWKVSMDLENSQRGFELKMFTPTPSENKKFFTKNGNAEKPEMIKHFYEYWDGAKLIPEGSTAQLNDVVDAFALMVFTYFKMIVEE